MALIDLHVHIHADSDKLDIIIKQNTEMAKKIDDLLAKQDRIDSTIDEVKKDLDFIKGQLGQGTEGGLTAEEATALEVRVDATLAKLGALDEETDSSIPEA